ncbi:MAG TPA: hypothetical protein VIW24_12005 [Aldersonia sp.]
MAIGRIAAFAVALSFAVTLCGAGAVLLSAPAHAEPTAPDPFAAARFDVAPVSPDCGFTAGRALAGHTSTDEIIGVWLEQPAGSEPVLPVRGMSVVWFDPSTFQGGMGQLDTWQEAMEPSTLALGVPKMAGAVSASTNETWVALFGTARNSLNTCTYLPGFKVVPAVPASE